ncbi:hypothetical protein CR513_18742, partial [Mucuna pruriens]
MVITVEAANFAMKKTLVDQGSSVDTFYMSTFRQLKIVNSQIKSYNENFVQYINREISTHCFGSYSVNTTFGHEVSFLHSTNNDQKMARQCYVDSLKITYSGTSAKKKENSKRVMENIWMNPWGPIEQGLEPIENCKTFN